MKKIYVGQSSRSKNAFRNACAGLVSAAVVNILPFITRSVFVSVLSQEYLGLNGLFTNILGVLSFSELGVGTAVTYSLYGPLAGRDYTRIAAIMRFYKKMSRIIALIILLSSLCILPFIDMFIKDSYKVDDLRLFYLIFLINSAITYMFIYRHVILQADQNSHIQSIISAIFMCLRIIISCTLLLVYKSYLLYLIGDFSILFFKNFILNKKIDALYPCVSMKTEMKLEPSELSVIKKNVLALIFHRTGAIGVYQSGSILLSYFIGLASVGLLSNYSMIINNIAQLSGVIFSGSVAGFGNAVITENKEKKHELFKVYSFIGFWIYSWTSVCLLSLVQPFIILWVGDDMALPFTVLLLMVVNHYLTGMRSIVENIKVAAGLYDNDKYVSIVQGGLSVVLSAIFIYYYGTAGLFLGLIISGLLPYVIKPVIVYKHVFSDKVSVYFHRQLLYIALTGLICTGVFLLNTHLFSDVNIINLLLRAAVCAVLPNAFLLVLFRKSKELQYVIKIIADFIKR